MTDSIRSWYGFTLAQMAADSYLDNINDPAFDIDSEEDVAERLRNGANYYKPEILQKILEENNLSATRMTDVMIIDFQKTWEIIDQIPNTSSGFSATLFKNKINGEFTISFRSTESKDEEDGGDVKRDSGEGANGQIKDKGFAFGQILDMEQYYGHIKQGESYDTETGEWIVNPRLNEFAALINNNGKLNVTGYSLGGHLAQIFTRLHYNDVIHTYTFNGAGFGDFTSIGNNATGEQYRIDIEGVLDVVRNLFINPLDLIDNIPDILLRNILIKVSKLDSIAQYFKTTIPDLTNKILGNSQILTNQEREQLVGTFQQIHNTFGQFFDLSSDIDIYLDPLFRYAVEAVSDGLRGAFRVSLSELLPDVGGDFFEFTRNQVTADSKITDLFGHAFPGDDRLLGESVAGSGQIFGEYLPIYIEDQPLFSFTKSNSFSDTLLRSFGPGHSITLLADSLAVMDVMKILDPGLTRIEMNQIFASAANSHRTTVIQSVLEKLTQGLFPGEPGAEGDTLEYIVNSLGKLFLPDSWAKINTAGSFKEGAYADLNLRNDFYNKLQLIRNEILNTQGEIKPEYQGLKITRISNVNDSPAELKLKAEGDPLALENPDDAIAYRYAIVHLNPFVVTGNNTIYNNHNLGGEIDLFNQETGKGTLTEDYLNDRSLFLIELIAANRNNQAVIPRPGENRLYRDIDSNVNLFINAPIESINQEHYLFGSDTPDETEYLKGGRVSDPGADRAVRGARAADGAVDAPLGAPDGGTRD